MTDTVTNHRDDRLSDRPTRKLSRPRMVLRFVILAFLLSTSSIAIAYAAQDSGTPAGTPQTEPTPSPEMPRLELELEELNDSGISGTVTLYDAGDDQTIVEFDVEGAGGDHPAHIHEGTCGNLEPEPYKSLENVDENGESMTVVDVSLDTLLADDYAIDIHLAPNELGTLIACADIEGEPVLAVAGTPEASPEATPTEAVGGTIATETATEPGTAVTTTPAPTEPADTETPVSQGSDGTSGAAPTNIVNQGGPSTTAPVGGDGTAGISGKGEPVATSTLPQQAGVGSALDWPEGPALTTMLASAGAALVLGTGGWIVRRGEHQTTTTPSRWSRLGI